MRVDEMEQVVQRLQAIETTLAEMSKAMIQLARVEERLSVNSDTHKTIFNKLEEHAKRIHDMEINSAKKLWLERLAWIIITAVMVFVVTDT